MLPGLFNIEKYIVKANLRCSIFYGNMFTLKYEVITKKRDLYISQDLFGYYVVVEQRLDWRQTSPHDWQYNDDTYQDGFITMK